LICDGADARAQPIRFAQFCANRAKIASPSALPKKYFSPADEPISGASGALVERPLGDAAAECEIPRGILRIYTNAQMQLMSHLAQYGCRPHIC
jgi:hypothetical protein